VECLTGTETVDHLTAQSAALHQLAESALEPNPFLSPWFLLPALKAFDPPGKVHVLLIRNPPISSPPGDLLGLFPLVLRRGIHGLPVRVWALWQHDYNYLGVPLVHRDHAPACMDALFCWLAQTQPGAGLLELSHLPAEGSWAHLLIDTLNRWDRTATTSEVHTRAFLQPGGRTGDAYLGQALSSKHRRDLHRLEKKLGELGPLELRSLSPGEEVRHWAEQFLALEASGWKGQEGTAIASKESHANFLRTLFQQAHAAGGLRLLGLFLGDQPVAMTCNLQHGRGGVAFKTAYDERYARFSPGVLLECHNIRRVAADPTCAWVDSCALPDHPMLNRLWLERRAMHTVLIPTGRFPGDLVLASFPLLRWFRRLFRRRKAPVSPGQVPG
jgi:CelD/BcsL family acetyltransferase involved in cellulose biosynthesis